MRTLSIVLAVLILGPGARRASASLSTGESSRDLTCPDWGKHYKERAKEIFTSLLDASGYDTHREAGRGPTEFRYVETDQTVAGSPAVALAARTGPNKSDHAIVIVTYGALQICRRDHLAFFVGHEIAHLALGHPQALAAFNLDLFNKWYERNADALANLQPNAVVARFQRENFDAIAAFTKPLEQAADANGLNLMASAGYDANEAPNAMLRARNWLVVQHYPTDDPAHGTLEQRAEQLAAYNRSLGRQARAGDALKKLTGL